VYMDETWVNQNDCTYYMWLLNDGSDAPKIPSGKGKRLIVLHAGTRSEGLIDGCDLVFLAKSHSFGEQLFLTKIWAHRIFCFNIVIACII
jgi:hypothetical protein